MKNTQNGKMSHKEMSHKERREQKRIKKVEGRLLSSFPILGTCLRVIFNPVSFASLIRYLYQVFMTYCVLQFAKKFHLSKIPVRYVDHFLDQKIPFTPSKIDIYLDFVKFWIQPITMLYSRVGYWKTTFIVSKYMNLLRLSYKASHQFYRYTLTTTHRPNSRKMKGFLSINLIDPHFLCVPSLHIEIITLCFCFFAKLFEDARFTVKEKVSWNRELFNSAVLIAESVLYVKQHSVNCIPAALYMLTLTFPDYVSATDCSALLESMFTHPPCLIPEKDATQIKDYMLFMYERFLLEGAMENDWREPVIRWINNYESQKE